MTLHLSPFPSPPRRAPGLRTRAALAVFSTAAVLAAGLATAPTAQSATDPSCPAAYPVADLTEGQPVTGLTVAKGTVPGSFTGEVIGVLDDYIAPDLDLVVVRLQSPALEEAGGVWYGMSGSPVYAADGRLIGAVSYGLSFSPSMIAGLTPAAEMLELLDSEGAAAQRTLAKVADTDTVRLPRAVSRELVASGAATQEEVAGGLSRLPLPVLASGRVPRQLKQVQTDLPTTGLRVYQGSPAPLAGPGTEIVPGGNLAASIAYGDLTYAAVGTATAVCGDEVIAFGHPFLYAGRNTFGMHGANTLLVQPDLFAPYKLVNLSAPVGLVDNEMISGVHGVVGDPPTTTPVTSYVEAAGRSRTGSSEIAFRADLPYLASWSMYLSHDRVLQAFTKGSGTATWTVVGTRAGGAPFRYVRSDRYASPWDIAGDIPWQLYMELDQLQNNDFEDVTITRVDTTSALSTVYERYTFADVQVRKSGRWTSLDPNKTLRLVPGTTARIKAVLTSRTLGKRAVVLAVPVPERARGKFGDLTVIGGNEFGGFEVGGNGGGYGDAAGSFDGLLRALRTAPRNDDVVATLSFYREDGSALRREVRETTNAVVDGAFYVSVRGVRR